MLGVTRHRSPALLLTWGVASLVGALAVAFATYSGLLELGLVALIAVVAGVAMLASLRVAVVLTAVSVPLEDFLVFDGAGTITKLVIIGLAGSYLFHLMRGRIRPRGGAVSPVGWVWVAWAGLSLFWARDPQVGQVTSLLQLFLLAYIVAAIVAERPLMARTMLLAYGASASATAILGVQRFFASSGAGGVTRISAVDGQGVEHFGAYLIPALLMAVILAIRKSNNVPARLAPALLAVLLMMGMLVSGTRSAWFAVLAALIVVILPRLRLRQVLSLVVALSIFLVAVLQVPALGTFIADRSLAAAATGGAGRVDIWKVGVGLISELPLFGVSYGGFSQYFGPQNVKAAPLPLEQGFVDIGRAPHSIYLSNVVELGLIGIVLFIVWMLPLLLALRGRGSYLIVIRASLFAYLVQGMYLDILNRKYFWLFVGLAEGCRYLIEARDGRVRQPR